LLKATGDKIFRLFKVMKNLNFLSVLCVLLVQNLSYSQMAYPFPQPNMQHTQVYNGDWTTGYEIYNKSFEYIGDSVVGSNTFARLEYVDMPGQYYHTYYDAGKVYYFIPNESLTDPFSGILLYDFSLLAGDSILLYNEESYYHVNLTNAILLPNGQTRKQLVFTNGVVWIDGIGDIERGFTYEYGSICGGAMEFVCQKDSSGLVKTNLGTAYECDINHPYDEPDTIYCSPFTILVEVVHETCAGVCDGSIEIEILDGCIDNCTYSIDGGVTQWNTNSFSGLCAWDYDIVIYDNLGTGNYCFATVNVQAGSSLEINIDSSSDVTCFENSDGMICAKNSGGAYPFIYSLSSGETNSNGCFFNLDHSEYTICVTDFNGCESCDSVIVLEPEPLSFSVQQTPASCDTCCDGNLEIIPSGGVPPYITTYTNVMTPLPDHFCTIDYQFCVSDVNGCQICDSVNVYSSASINENQELAPFTFYPNPSMNEITFETTNNNGELKLVDMYGRIVYQKKVVELKSQIQVSEFANGIYILSYMDNFQLIVIQH
jgi:hypothetical protein